MLSKNTGGNPKMTRVSHFDPKSSELHDTREMGDLKTAADHQLWIQNRSGSSTLEHKCVSVVKKQWREEEEAGGGRRAP